MWKNHPIFHISLIKPVSEDPIAHPIKQPTPPIKVEGEEEWEVEEILKSRMFCKQLQYLIHWKGNEYSSIMELYESGQQFALHNNINWECKKVKFMHNTQLAKY
jgi:hypothetical protein